MSRFLSIIITLLLAFQAKAYEPRDLLQKKATLQRVKESLVPKDQWIKYPAYTSRAGWDILTGAFKAGLIKKGERFLNYEWMVVTASDYLAYERTGSRKAMEDPFGRNNTALSNLFLAELAEGKGRFMDQIINGVWQTCEMSSWALSAHLPAQKSKRSLPDFNEEIIDLTSGDLGSFLSWAWYFFHDEWDKVNPIISSRLLHELQRRILVPYMARSDYWWQAFHYKPGMLVNNWNPWCNFNVLTCFLLLEDDKDKLAEAVYRSMTSVDQFINYVNEDGACEEGPSYWGHAAGKLYDYLQLLSYATNGQVSIFNEPMIKNMGEYIARSYVGDGWVVNFADASAKGKGDPGLVFRFGKAVNSEMMQQFASFIANRITNDEINEGRDFFRTIENLASYKELLQTKASLPSYTYTWYPQTQFCYMKNNQGFFFAAKGGHNNESHNHNDVGTFSLYMDETPFFIDAGVGTYTRQTFSNERYTIWTMQSNYHNLPQINGEAQQYGAKYRAKVVVFDANKMFLSMDISGAYSKDAEVEKWKRTYILSSTNGLIIEDVFQLKEAKAPNQLNFITWGKPDISHPGEVIIEKNGKRVKFSYNPSMFLASVDTIEQTDSRLSNVWGKEIYRLSLRAKKQQSKGKYRFTINKF